MVRGDCRTKKLREGQSGEEGGLVLYPLRRVVNLSVCWAKSAAVSFSAFDQNGLRARRRFMKAGPSG